MSAANLCRLLLLGALWGGSHMLTRIAVPQLGPAALIMLRLLLGALTLSVLLRVVRKAPAAPGERHYAYLLVLGFLNCALPFLLIAHAAQTLTASLMAILNATAPIWGALITALLMRRLPGKAVCLGLALGMFGVALIVGLDPELAAAGHGLAVAEMLAATFCYGLASNLIRRAPVGMDATRLAGGSMWLALPGVLPLLAVSPPMQLPSPAVAVAVLALGVLCTGVAYILYFRLVEETGATSALTVTFLIPLFGVLWGHLFLDEVLALKTLLGALIVLLGTALSTGVLRWPGSAHD